MRQLLNIEFNLRNELETLVEFIVNELKFIAQENYRNVVKISFLQQLYRFNEIKKYYDKKNNEIFAGRIIDVGKHGNLIIMDTNNVVRTFDFKDVTFVLQECNAEFASF
jgi:hypothetical protein